MAECQNGTMANSQNDNMAAQHNDRMTENRQAAQQNGKLSNYFTAIIGPKK